MKKTDGFTLIEAIITLVVVAMVIAVGIPGLSSIMANNQAAAHSNSLITAFSFARSESVKQGVNVSICARDASAQDGFTCGEGDNDWADGWFVFLDPDGNAAAGYTPPADERRRSWPAQPGNYTVTAPVAVGFNSSGSIQGDADAVFSLIYEYCTGEQNRTITITTTGHTSVKKEPCTDEQ